MRLRRTAAVLTAALLLTPAPAAFSEVPTVKVYVANSGRDIDGNTGPHNIAIFSVRADGGLTPFGDPVPTGLGARSLEFRPDGRFAYLVALAENAVYAYTRTGDGGLVPLTRVGTGGDSPFGLAVAPDGRSLYTANIGDDTVSAFTIGAGGVPTLVQTVPTGQEGARNAIVSRDGRFLFVSHGFPDNPGPDALVVFPIVDGKLGRPRPPVPIGGGGTGMALTPNGRFLYIACSGTNEVVGFRVGHDGVLTPVPGASFPAPRTPEGVAITPDGGRLFVTSVASQPVPNPAEAGVWTFTIGDDGELTRKGQRVDSGFGPGIATPDGKHLFTSDFFGNTVTAFDISTGRPRPVAQQPSGGLAPAFDALATR